MACEFFGTDYCNNQKPDCRTTNPQNYYGLGRAAGCYRTASAKQEKEKRILEGLPKVL